MQLDESTVWLKEELGPKAFFPDPSTCSFQFTSDVGRSIRAFIVHGAPNRKNPFPAISVGSRSHNSVVTPSICGSTYRPVFSGKKLSVNVKVVQAHVTKSSTGKLEFHRLGQAFIDVNESTANVFHITEAIQNKWGEEYVLVTADGLQVEDSSGTQGIYIYKLILALSKYCGVHNYV